MRQSWYSVVLAEIGDKSVPGGLSVVRDSAEELLCRLHSKRGEVWESNEAPHRFRTRIYSA